MLKNLIVTFSLLLSAISMSLICVPLISVSGAQENEAVEKVGNSVEFSGGQASIPIGLTVQVKAITLGEDAVTVRLLASFDSSKTSSIEMNGYGNAFLFWGDENEGGRGYLHLRQIADNPAMRISNGQTMEGDLLFPGKIPTEVKQIWLFFNDGHTDVNTSSPGITIPLELKQ